MTEPTLMQNLQYYGTTLNVPEGNTPTAGYRSLLIRAAAEIDRLMGLQAPVTCAHCRKEIERADEWYRCTDCGGHYHLGCITAHARDWKPLHASGADYAELAALLREGRNQSYGVMGIGTEKLQALESWFAKVDAKLASSLGKVGEQNGN